MMDKKSIMDNLMEQGKANGKLRSLGGVCHIRIHTRFLPIWRRALFCGVFAAG